MVILKISMAYVTSCICVGFVWMVVVAIEDSTMSVGEALGGWAVVAMLVGAVSLLPFAILRWAAWRLDRASWLFAVISGAFLGAASFALFFGAWVSWSNAWDYAVMLSSGAGLGAIGGLVYVAAENWLGRSRLRQESKNV